MPNIRKVNLAGSEYDLVDTSSGYSTFSATQTMPSTTTGASRVASFSYQTRTPGGSLSNTTTVNFYSTGGTQSGNEWSAHIDPQNNENLIFSSNN